jgi:hypothetical protein
MSVALGDAARIAGLLAQPGVEARHGQSAAVWPFELPEPPDLTALYQVADGVTLPDGTVVLPRGELAGATAWLKHERSLDWASDLLVLGEREDLVIVLDLDPARARGGGGVLEAPTDALAAFRRISRSTIGYLERRMHLGDGQDAAPEVRAQEAAERRDLAALSAALAEPMYPGAERQLAHAALTFGLLLAERGEQSAAIEAFERSVAARVAVAPRGAGESERAAAWRACAIAAREAGREALSVECSARARGGRG